MNHTIKKLKEQATSYTWNGDGVTEELDADLFAKLLVKECMKLCLEVKEDVSTIKDDDRRDLAEMSATFCYEAIKGEFGVEE